VAHSGIVPRLRSVVFPAPADDLAGEVLSVDDATLGGAARTTCKASDDHVNDLLERYGHHNVVFRWVLNGNICSARYYRLASPSRYTSGLLDFSAVCASVGEAGPFHCGAHDIGSGDDNWRGFGSILRRALMPPGVGGPGYAAVPDCIRGNVNTAPKDVSAYEGPDEPWLNPLHLYQHYWTLRDDWVGHDGLQALVKFQGRWMIYDECSALEPSANGMIELSVKIQRT